MAVQRTYFQDLHGICVSGWNLKTEMPPCEKATEVMEEER
jgi:hypothetical protein